MFFVRVDFFISKFETYMPKFETYVPKFETYIPKFETENLRKDNMPVTSSFCLACNVIFYRLEIIPQNIWKREK